MHSAVEKKTHALSLFTPHVPVSDPRYVTKKQESFNVLRINSKEVCKMSFA